MDDSMDLDYFKRELGPSMWDPSTGNTEPSVTWGTDGFETPVTVEASQMAASQSRVSEASSLSEGSLEILGGTASVIPASSATTSESIPTRIVLMSSSSAEPESTTPPTTTSAYSNTPTETRISLFGTVASTTSASTFETAAPGAYAGGGDSVKNKLAIALPIAIVGLLLIIALVFFFFCRRRRRTTRPPYEMTGNATAGVSTAALMTSPKITIAPPEPATSNLPRVPIIDVTRSQSHDHQPTPGSASARSDDDARTELGIAAAVPMDQRLSATEHHLREFSRPVSSVSHRVSAGPPSAGLASVRMPFENQSSDDNDAVSIISGEHGRGAHDRDFDDMSSVSSFNDEHPETEGHDRSFR